MTPTPAGWYPDPSSPSTLRYWDGASWTPHRQAVVSPFSQSAMTAPAGTDGNTVWIWLATLIPAVPTLMLLFVPWGSMFDFDPYMTDPTQMLASQLAVYTSPLFLVSSVLGYVAYGLGVFFSYRDARVLAARGVPRPFPWGWSFLYPVYPIGRSVVVKRRTGRGYGPLWAAIAVMALSVIVSIVILVIAFAGMADMMREFVPSY